MEKINYTLTLDDCNNYAKSQSKIPRIKKVRKIRRVSPQSSSLCYQGQAFSFAIFFDLFMFSFSGIK